jgi:hypothetical protein
MPQIRNFIFYLSNNTFFPSCEQKSGDFAKHYELSIPIYISPLKVVIDLLYIGMAVVISFFFVAYWCFSFHNQ